MCDKVIYIKKKAEGVIIKLFYWCISVKICEKLNKAIKIKDDHYEYRHKKKEKTQPNKPIVIKGFI